MKNKNVLITVAILVVIGIIVGGYAISGKNSPKTNKQIATTITGTQVTNTATLTPIQTNISATDTSTPAPTGKIENFTINANDDSADLTSIHVSSGDTVKITFNVENQGTYHGGLNFVAPNPAYSSGPVAMGASKTVVFTAAKSFVYTPYWYTTNVQKPYNISVTVS